MEKIKIEMLGALPEHKVSVLNINGAAVQVSQTIPYEQILDSIQWAVNYIVDDRTFISGPLREIITNLAVLRMYTNIDLSPIENIGFEPITLYEWYDILILHDIFNIILKEINPDQYQFFYRTLEQTLTSIIQYRNSAAGIVERIQDAAAKDQNNLQTALETLGDEDKMKYVHQVMKMMAPEEVATT